LKRSLSIATFLFFKKSVRIRFDATKGWDNCGPETAAIGRSGMGKVMVRHKSH
jgi:hypothetical protein